MLCSSCSRSFDGVTKFCAGCGQPLNQPVQVQERLHRARYGRMIAGVCAGFAQSYGADVTVVRLLVCVVGLFSAATVVLAYLIAWIVMPTAPYALPVQAAGVTAS